MDPIEKGLQAYQDSLCKELDIISLRKRNPVAHKWKVTYQSLCIRETVAWRFVDILSQSWFLHKNGKSLGARILLRSAIETLAMLIYHNQLSRKVVAGKIDFKTYMEKTVNLMSGSRDGLTDQQATSILTVLKKCEAKYEGIEKLYAWLSESAHPNYEGMRLCFSETDREKMVTTFVNRASLLYSEMHESGVFMAMSMYEHEYNNEWHEAFEELEDWLVQNDEKLNAEYKSGT